MEEITISKEEYERLKKKADKWDKLHDAIDKHYEEDSDSDLCNIGETAACAFGYL